ncbi:Clp protease N-terminal domain-containing protein [Streptomyces sp. NPDC058299]|uniref:Clp protease N-terminal domain-containing protein n=1 Tax=Streptomyces sp. NPDC058299 TaxID=3346435 RepID=UPI0036E36784
MSEHFAAGARTAVSSAVEEARLRGDRRIGTEHLILGVLHEPGSVTVRAFGTDVETARTALGSRGRSHGTARDRPSSRTGPHPADGLLRRQSAGGTADPARPPPRPRPAVLLTGGRCTHRNVEPTAERVGTSERRQAVRAS